MRGLKDKVVVVTGGGGIGGATCSRFAAEGAKVAVFDMNLESAATSMFLISPARRWRVRGHAVAPRWACCALTTQT